MNTVTVVDGMEYVIPRPNLKTKIIFFYQVIRCFMKYTFGKTSECFTGAPSWVVAIVVDITPMIMEDETYDEHFQKSWTHFCQGARIELRYRQRRNHHA
jgi:hypothetical protein